MTAYLIVGALLAAGAAAFLKARSEARPQTGVTTEAWVPADTSIVRLALTGLSCGSCATTARLAIQRVEGVHRAEVEYRSGGPSSGKVWYDRTKTSPEVIIAKLKELTGYEARVVEDQGRDR
jgi:copper chaperone CopZ